jgi:hypothetical protein
MAKSTAITTYHAGVSRTETDPNTFQEVVVNLVHVGDGANGCCGNMTLLVERLDGSHDSYVNILPEKHSCSLALIQ